MKIQNEIAAVLVLASSVLAGPVLAFDGDQQGAPDPSSIAARFGGDLPLDPPSAERRERFLNPLSLTDPQMEKMAALKDQYKTDTAAKKAELRSLHMKIRELITQPTIDRQAITSLNGRITALRNELSGARLSYMLDRAEILTPDQRGQLHHMMLLRQSRMGHQKWQAGCKGPGGRHEGFQRKPFSGPKET